MLRSTVAVTSLGFSYSVDLGATNVKKSSNGAADVLRTADDVIWLDGVRKVLRACNGYDVPNSAVLGELVELLGEGRLKLDTGSPASRILLQFSACFAILAECAGLAMKIRTMDHCRTSRRHFIALAVRRLVA